jgi:RNA polymerase sigma-70 factor (ECF subfamily)
MDAVTAAAMRAAQGDRSATEQFVRETQGAVWRLCAHLVDRSAADDLTQETYLRALRSLSGFRGESSARTWILAVARHTCLDEVRRRGRGRALLRRVWAQPAAAVTEEVDQSGAVALAALVAALPVERREAFVLTQVLGLSYLDAAEVCGCEVGTIRSRVARARAELVALVAEDSGSEGAGSS